MHSVEAIYSGGVFRPLEAVAVAENQRVRLTIDSLPAPPVTKAITTAQDLIDSNLVGIWSDRTDIPSGLEFANRIRKEAEKQRGLNHAAG